MQIITISGKAESGKDTTARMIKDELEDLGYEVLICHYADLLKYICRQFFAWDGQKNDEGRTILQKVGTDTIRKQNPEFWVGFIETILDFFPEEWDYVLIPDTRFPNEIESLKSKEYDVKTLHINRPGYDNHLTDEQRQHPSETSLDEYKFDYYIDNPSTKDGLRKEVKRFIDDMFSANARASLVEKIKEML